MNVTRAGFTIVELLIVIVVIAILAAISMVAYTDIQGRAKQTAVEADVDKIGKAIQLWSAQNGTTLWSSGAGWAGQGYGFFHAAGGSYTSTSVETLLRNAGYLTGTLSINNVLLAPCSSNVNDPRWVVLVTMSPAPTKTVREAIPSSQCPYGLIDTYSTPPNYPSNFAKVY
jgi:prepilin-type N-terminal cleavage/methylation domain-containing protein